MTDWNNPKNFSITFDVKADEKSVDFFNRFTKEIGDFEKAIDERIRQLFVERFGEHGKEKNEGYDIARKLFMIGYQYGWNDHFDLTFGKTKEDDQ
jgi:hypothetical protein